MTEGAAFYTVSDQEFFVGTVALLNSLRLCGHTEELVVLDIGLTDTQRELLGPYARVVQPPPERSGSPFGLTAYPFLLGATGVVAMIDSDMIVTAPLTDALARAEAGQIGMGREESGAETRWFAEWETLVPLSAPLRRQEYLNAGFVVLSVDHWPGLLERWWRACRRVDPATVHSDPTHPLCYIDQDILNALLMSEVPEAAVSNLPEIELIYASNTFDGVTISDRRNLICHDDGRRLSILHHDQRPKVWQAGGWPRALIGDPYATLLPRLLFADDVVCRLSHGDSAWWVEDNLRSRLGSCS